MFRLMTLRRLEARVPVIDVRVQEQRDGGAERQRREVELGAADGLRGRDERADAACSVAGLIDAKCVCAAPKMWLQPPSLVGM